MHITNYKCQLMLTTSKAQKRENMIDKYHCWRDSTLLWIKVRARKPQLRHQQRPLNVADTITWANLQNKTPHDAERNRLSTLQSNKPIARTTPNQSFRTLSCCIRAPAPSAAELASSGFRRRFRARTEARRGRNRRRDEPEMGKRNVAEDGDAQKSLRAFLSSFSGFSRESKALSFEILCNYRPLPPAYFLAVSCVFPLFPSLSLSRLPLRFLFGCRNNAHKHNNGNASTLFCLVPELPPVPRFIYGNGHGSF